jgi:hypothetical protein
MRLPCYFLAPGMILSPTREDTLSNMVRSSFQLVKMMVKGGELRVQKYRIIFIIPHYRHRNLLVRQKNQPYRSKKSHALIAGKQ